MAAKLILSMDGVVLKEYALSKERMTIGRKAHNDIVIDNLAVSGEHAAIVTILNDSFLEDLDSTNGVAVNGVQIKKHFLQNNDVVEIGKYKLKYLNDQQSQMTAADFEKTMVLRSPSGGAPVAKKADETVTLKAAASHEPTGKFETYKASLPPAPQPALEAAAQHAAAAPAAPAATGVPPAVVQILTGPNTGKELELVKNLTTLGKPGLQVAVLTRRPHGYFITHVEGATFPILNGTPLDEHPHQLNDHDIIELAGVKMEFYFKV
jgi:pSer/pThr/pTyr-binding forkhead associated (FHA) protein